MEGKIVLSKRLPIYVSIDFEDFSHDYLRDCGILEGELNREGLWKSYEAIKVFCNKYLENKKLTFFITGVIAKKMPEIVKAIHNDGHEVANHFNYHDSIYKMTISEFKMELDSGIASIKNITDKDPLGFRAPKFSINAESAWAYSILADRFKYDSSFKTDKGIEEATNQLENILNGKKIKECFVYKLRLPFTRISISAGGTYLRLFPVFLTMKCLREQYKKGFVPILYLHPYELVEKKTFWIPFNRFNGSFPIRIQRWIRQLQWLKVGHSGIDRKLRAIFSKFEHHGCMSNILDHHEEKNPNTASY